MRRYKLEKVEELNIVNSVMKCFKNDIGNKEIDNWC